MHEDVINLYSYKIYKYKMYMIFSLLNKMRKRYHTVGIVQIEKSEKQAPLISLTYIYMSAHFTGLARTLQ